MARSRESTRDELIASGVRVYRTLSGDLLRGLTAGRVAKEAGYHRQTFYRYWDTQAEYVNDLIRELVSPSQPPLVDGAAVLPARRSEQQDPVDLLRDVARFDYSLMVADATVTMRIGLLTIGALDEESLAARVQEYYETSIETLTVAFEDLLETWGREPVPPFTTRELVRIKRALLLGLVLQGKAAEDHPSAGDLYENVLPSLVFALTVPTDVSTVNEGD